MLSEVKSINAEYFCYNSAFYENYDNNTYYFFNLLILIVRFSESYEPGYMYMNIFIVKQRLYLNFRHLQSSERCNEPLCLKTKGELREYLTKCAKTKFL